MSAGVDRGHSVEAVFEFEDPRATWRWGTDVDPQLVALNAEGTFRINVHPRLVYEEAEYFPIVELRLHLDKWLRTGFPLGQDFEFEAMDSEEPGVVWIRHVGRGWRVGALEQHAIALDVLTDAQVRETVNHYVSAVDSWARGELGRDLAFLFEEYLRA